MCTESLSINYGERRKGGMLAYALIFQIRDPSSKKRSISDGLYFSISSL